MITGTLKLPDNEMRLGICSVWPVMLPAIHAVITALNKYRQLAAPSRSHGREPALRLQGLSTRLV